MFIPHDFTYEKPTCLQDVWLSLPPRSQLLEEIETKFRRLSCVFGVNVFGVKQSIQRKKMNDIRPNCKSEIPYGGLKTGITIISACIQDKIYLNGCTNVFRVQLSNGICRDVDRPIQKQEIQDGGLETSTWPPSWISHLIIPTTQCLLSRILRQAFEFV